MKRFLPLLIALILAAPALRGGDDKAPAYEVEVVKDVAYNGAADADAERHKLDLYLPRGAKGYPVLFFIHGGGWNKGKKDGFAAHGRAFARQGIGFVATNYRLTPVVKHPGHVEDVAQAFAWCHANLGKRGADVKQMFVSGHSAGGHLCALLATDEGYLKRHKLSLSDIKGVIPISGVFDVSGERLADRFGEDGKKASPMSHLKGNLPPFLVFYADKELGALGKQAEAFAKAAKALKCDVEVKMIKDRDHGTIMRNAAKPDDEVSQAMVAFIRKHSGAR
ncbi:MAG: alpha/beta hydrolase [Gemmataceae bacterium]